VTAVTSPRPAPAAPSPAVAPPPGNPRFALFDSLRAIAVLFVISFHVTSLTGAINRPVFGDLEAVLGNQALILFFVISGFLLYRPYVAARAAGRRAPNLRRYARRRVLRIVPAYWVALTVLAIYPGIVGPFGHDGWRYYLFLQLYSQHTFGTGIPVAWSLCVEVTFYLTLPLWASVMRRLRFGAARAWWHTELVALAIVALGGALVQLAAARQIIAYVYAQSLLGECTWIALGRALAVVSVVQDHDTRGSPAHRFVEAHAGLCWLAAGACLAGLTAMLHPGGLLNIIVALRTKQPVATTLGGIALTLALSTLLVLPAVFGDPARGWPRRLLATRVIAWLGIVSYGVYLWHLAVAELLARASDPAHFSAPGLNLAGHVHFATTLVLFVLTLAVSSALAALSYRVVELPFLRRKEGRVRPREAGGAPATPTQGGGGTAGAS
jgi:peptidoglycan/LPS O-acetylase OafA/YrhL